jgi:hypothetical protein
MTPDFRETIFCHTVILVPCLNLLVLADVRLCPSGVVLLPACSLGF